MNSGDEWLQTVRSLSLRELAQLNARRCVLCVLQKGHPRGLGSQGVKRHLMGRRLKLEEGTSLGDDRSALMQATGSRPLFGTWSCPGLGCWLLAAGCCHICISRPSSAVPSGRREVRTGIPSDKGREQQK